MAGVTGGLSRFTWPIVIAVILLLLGIAVVYPESGAVKFTVIRLDSTYDPGCISFNVTSGMDYSSYSSITITGALRATSYCHVNGTGIETLGFGYISSNTPLTVNANSTGTLSLVLDTPTSYSGQLVICVYNFSWNTIGNASCP